MYFFYYFFFKEMIYLEKVFQLNFQASKKKRNPIKIISNFRKKNIKIQ